MKTITTIIKTDAFKYAIFAFMVATVAFFAVLPFISDINPHVSGPSLSALLVTADDGGGDGAGGDGSGGDSGGGGDTGTGDTGSGDGAGTPADGCCGGGGGDTGGTPTDPGSGGGEVTCTPIWNGCGGYWYQNSCIYSCPTGTHAENVSGANNAQYCGTSYNSCVPNPVVVEPSCTISANPKPCTLGANSLCGSTISWSTQNMSNPAVFVQSTGQKFAADDSGSQLAPWIDHAGVTFVVKEQSGSAPVICSVSVSGVCASGTTWNGSACVAPVTPVPTCTLTASPSSITEGGSATLTWTTDYATRASLTGDSAGATRLDGSKTVSPTNTTTYTLTAEGPSGTATCSKTVTVTKPYVPPTPSTPSCSLTVAHSSITAGQQTTLSWNTSNFQSYNVLEIDHGIGNVTPPLSGSKTISPTVTTTYTGHIVDFSPTNAQPCSVTVTVIPVTPAPTCTLTASPTSVNQGSASTLSWTTSNASSISIDQGVGAVGVSGSQSVSPSATKTYTLTATGAGGSVTCTKTVTVIPTPSAPTCTLTASPTSVNQGSASTLSWTTTNATSVSINQGIGAVGVSGSKSVSPSNTTSYTLTATGAGGTVTCEKQVTVVVPNPAPTCTLTASPTSVNQGSASTLSWTTSNATSVSINQGIGAVGANSSRSVTPTNTTTYTLTATGAGGTVTCEKQVTVVVPNPAPTCTLEANPTSINQGGASTLSWTTTNASSVTLNEGIGAVAMSGSRSVSPSVTKTYTLTADGAGGTVTCSKTVTVVIPNPAPTCTITVNPQSMTRGNSAILSWSTTNATAVVIDNNIGTVSLSGTHTVSPTVTTEYKLSAVGAGGSVLCKTTLAVNEPPAHPTCALNANKTSITAGESVTLTWSSTNATMSTLQGTNVALSGSGVYTPATTTTYNYVVTGAGGTETCTKTITVTPYVPVSPVCTLTVSPNKITKGSSATLNWTVGNASIISIDQGIGTISATGSRSVNPTANTTYTLTARGEANQTVTCVASLVVEEPHVDDPVKCDAFSASPSTLNAAGTTTLTWNTSNATNVSINNGVGTVSEDGSKSVFVAANTTYTLTATDGDKTVTCQSQVNIVPVVTVPKCDAFTVSPSSLNKGETATLTWSTTNASSVSINNGVGTVAVDGNTSVTVNADTTYTLTATNGSASDSCQATVTIKSSGGGGGGGSSSPRCTLTASDKKITAGQQVTLTWKNTRTNDIILKDSRGNVLADSKKDSKVDEDAGSIKVKPTKSTSYTLTVIKGSKKRDCTVDINVSNVTVSSNRPLVAGISLSQVPYTGFDAGPFLTTIFYSLIVLWGLGIAYVLVIRGNKNNASLSTLKPVQSIPMIKEVAPVHRIPTVLVAPTVTTAPQNLKTVNPVVGYESLYATAPAPVIEEEVIEEATVEPQVEDTTALLEGHAHDARVLMSSDALRFIAGQSALAEEQLAILDKVIGLAKAQYPSENGWVIVNKEKMMSLLS